MYKLQIKVKLVAIELKIYSDSVHSTFIFRQL